MKSLIFNESFVKQQIKEKNDRIENYIVNYLLSKNSSEHSSNSNTLENLNKKHIQRPPLPKKKKIPNSRTKIKQINPKKDKNEFFPNSFFQKIIDKKNKFDNEDSTITTRRTMATMSQKKENKENLDINLSYVSNSIFSINDLNKSKIFGYKNQIKKNGIVSKNNFNFFLKKNPCTFNHNNKKGLTSVYSYQNIHNLNNMKSVDNGNQNLKIDISENSSFKRRKTFDNSFNLNHINYNLKDNNKDSSSDELKSRTIETIKTIRRIKNPKIIIMYNNTNTNGNFIYNKKNIDSSFSQDKNIKKNSKNNNFISLSQERNLKNNKKYNLGSYNPNKDNYEENILKELNLEDFLLIIQKFENIKSFIYSLPDKIKNVKQVLVIMSTIRIKIYDLYKYYFGCSFEGAPENLFISKNIKVSLHYYSIIFVLSLGLLYIITNKVKMTQEYFPQIINIFNFQQKLFLLLSDMVIHKIKINNEQRIWVRDIMNILNNKLMFNTENHILDMKKIILNSYYLISEVLEDLKIKNKNKFFIFNEQEVFYMNFYLRNNLNSLFRFDINNIETLFNNKIFNIFNIKSNYANITSHRTYSKNRSLNNILNNIKYKDILEVIIPPTKNESIEKRPKIPYLNFPRKKEYTLILDLDETMINFKWIDINQRIGKIILRPGLENFLEVIKEFYEIIVFTSATKEYADIILNIIELKGNNKYFDGRLYREHNIQIGQKFYKDLTKLGRDLSRTIIVDNFNQSFKFQKDNGILISSFYGENIDDKSLIELQKILIKIYNEKCDVRNSINKYKEDIFRKISNYNKF